MLVNINGRDIDSDVYLVPQDLPTKEEFLAWLQAVPDGLVFCNSNSNRCVQCPIAAFTHKLASTSILQDTWAYGFMRAFDADQATTKEEAIAAYHRVFS